MRIASGEFRDGDHIHRGSGQLEILTSDDGRTIVRLENMEIVTGPDLYVYLAKEADPLFPEDVTTGFVSLGDLKAQSGDQNYIVPAEIELSDWGSVVIWCKAYKVLFATATIERP